MNLQEAILANYSHVTCRKSFRQFKISTIQCTLRRKKKKKKKGKRLSHLEQMREIALKIKSHATPQQFLSQVGLQSYLYNSLFNAYITSFFPISGNS